MNADSDHRVAHRPTIGVVPGDPNGIGHEILVKTWASGALHPHCRPLVVGDADLVEHTVRLLGASLSVRRVADIEHLPGDCGDDASTIDVLVSDAFPVAAMRLGQDTRDAGAVSGAWLDHADRLAQRRILDGAVMGPISAKAMDMAGTLHAIPSHKPGQEAYLLLRSGPLVVAHLTDHVPLRDVSAAITQDAVLRLVTQLARAMTQWGLGGGRIGVAGFNPHASGVEEQQHIAPAIERARAQGINVEGPVSPDSIFRQCIEGRYQAVIATYHDQGHIAIKTWGFSGNNVVFLGPPYAYTTVAHGVAYDLAGSGRADHSMLQNAILNAASLAAGRGFH
ncbi:PdxA family dehydrogenase [Panacagrimonas sp.]|uniref:PdxA family dehydrogenase n=1 Tax=Panacagrimonas sp. TaxID=2480088 RepID=UPI003B5303F2